MNSGYPVAVSPRIADLLEGRESETLEFKSRLSDSKSIARLVVAFANTNGGTLIVGVDDSGQPVGLPDDEAIRIRSRLSELAANILQSDVSAGIVDVAGRSVVYLDVPKAPPNLAPLATAAGEFFVRRGSAIARADGEDLVRAARSAARATGTEPETTVHRVANGIRGRRTPLQLFVAMSFAFEEDPVLVDHFEAIKRAVRRAPVPIKVRRVDLEPGDYEISQPVMDLISEADIVLADFTRSPPNVYFEAGYARRRGKPVLQTARAGTVLQFDVKTWRTTFFKNATELEEKLVGEIASLVIKSRRPKKAPKRRRRK